MTGRLPHRLPLPFVELDACLLLHGADPPICALNILLKLYIQLPQHPRRAQFQIIELAAVDHRTCTQLF